MIGRLAEMLVLLTRRVEELLLPVPARPARYLLDLCDEQLGPAVRAPLRGLAGPGWSPAAATATPAPRVCRLPTTKRELAARLGTVPETLSRTLDQLKRSRVIHLSGGGEPVEVLDFAALRRLAHR